MKRIILYIASSIDGRIATADGGIEWLDSISNPNHEDYGYEELLQSVDTIIMGNKTYQKILSFNIPWPYPGKQTYVITHKAGPKDADAKEIEFITDDVYGKITTLKSQSGKDIWLVGGGQIDALLANENLIDEMRIFIAPTILGEGIPIFAGSTKPITWKLIECRHYDNGGVILIYRK